MIMQHSGHKRIQIALRMADVLLLFGLCVVAYFFPRQLMSTQGYVAAVAWYLGIHLVGGQNPAYLRPRYRIFISMGLSLLVAAVIGILWAGSGWTWYMKGGLHALALLAVAGTAVRLILAQFAHHPTIQVVPFRIPASHRPLLRELACQPHVHVEDEITDPTAPLPARRPGYAEYLIASDLRLREADFHTLQPLLFSTEVVDLCDLYESVLGKAAMIEGEEGWTMVRNFRHPAPMRGVLKRLFDITFVLATAPISLTVTLLAAVIIRCTSAGPVFFTQQRLGRHGRPFKLIKLRTMVVNAEAQGPRWSGAHDPRITPFGRFLRAAAIDELPQLWNVLCGELSLVGPRPECPAIAEKLAQQIPLYQARLLLDPGITGWAQLHQGSDTDIADVANKLAYDLYYMQYNSLAQDCQILLRTVQMILHLAKPAPQKTAAAILSPSQV